MSERTILTAEEPFEWPEFTDEELAEIERRRELMKCLDPAYRRDDPPKPSAKIIPFDPRPLPKPPESIVYIIRCGDFVKIGTTFDMPRRMKGIETGNPFEIVLIATHPGDTKLERELHEVFAEYRHRGEWFRIEGELAAWIEQGCPYG